LFSNTLNLCSSLSVIDQVPHPHKTTGKLWSKSYTLIFKFLDRIRKEKCAIHNHFNVSSVHKERSFCLPPPFPACRFPWPRFSLLYVITEVITDMALAYVFTCQEKRNCLAQSTSLQLLLEIEPLRSIRFSFLYHFLVLEPNSSRGSLYCRRDI
jgi:hypothetical protein